MSAGNVLGLIRSPLACSSSPPCSRSAARGSCGKKCGRAGLAWIGAGIIALGLLAAYGGIFVAGSLAWGIAIDGFRPDRYDIVGALTCLLGVAVIMYAPRG